MPVGVHKAWHDNRVRSVNHLGIRRTEIRPDGGDLGAFDEYIGLPEVADLLIEAEDTTVLQ
jgi:hypothetical protein